KGRAAGVAGVEEPHQDILKCLPDLARAHRLGPAGLEHCTWDCPIVQTASYLLPSPSQIARRLDPGLARHGNLRRVARPVLQPYKECPRPPGRCGAFPRLCGTRYRATLFAFPVYPTDSRDGARQSLWGTGWAAGEH